MQRTCSPRFFWLAGLAASLMAGCASHAPVADVPTLALPTHFKQAALAPVGTQPALSTQTPAPADRWWSAYGDPALEALVERSNQGNTGIQATAARLAYAQAQARHTQAAKAPALNLQADATRQTGPLLNATGEEGSLFTVGATVSYELDVWGRLAQSGTAASLDAQSRESLLGSARLLSQAHVVQAYLHIRALDADMGLLQQSLRAQQDALRISEHRFQGGSLSALELEIAREEASAVQTSLLNQQQRRNEQEHLLATLLGEPASTFALPPSDHTPTLPMVRPGMPATVLARRPDVAAAQRTAEAALQRLGAAKTAWLPTMALTAAGGYASPDLSTLFNTSMQTLVLGVLANLPLLDGGRREAATAMAEAELRAAAASHREQALVALREVEDQLSAAKNLAQQYALAERAAQSAARRSTLTASRYRNGLSSQLEWLESQRLVLAAQRHTAQVRADQYQASVALVRAVGGAWE